MKSQKKTKFVFEKFEMANLSTLKNTQGGHKKIKNCDDPGTVTDVVDAIKSIFCQEN